MGGPKAVADLTGRSPAAVCQWRTSGRGIPPDLYFILRAAAARKGVIAPASLFGFEQVDEAV